MVDYFNDITFAHPGWFWGLLVIPFLVLWYVLKRHQQTPAVKISSLKGFQVKQGILPRLRPLLFAFRMLGLVLLITAMATPQTVEVSKRVETKNAIDIVLAIDVSASMLARDFTPNRLEATKEVAATFVKNRPNDRIGLVIYAGESYTKVPVTSDKRIVLNAIHNISYNGILKDGTAIGMGLATAINRLKNSEAKSKVVILMTDGVNNAGFIAPKTAAELAVKFGIKVYTIGVGSNGYASSPVAILPNGKFHFARVKVQIDEDLMKAIAQKTGGQYFRATDEHKLQQIYDEINKLEKTKVKEFTYTNYTDKYRPLVILGGIFLLLEFVLRYTLFRSFV